MTDDLNLDAYLTSPFSSDLRKQRDSAFESARNIRKVTETPEEFRLRMAQEKIERLERLRAENTDILKERLANMDISSIATKNRIAIEHMIKDAESIKMFALFNHYDMNAVDFTNLDRAIKVAQLRLKSMKNGKDEDERYGVFIDNYKKSVDEPSLLDKLAGGSAQTTDYSNSIKPKYR